MNQNPNQKKTDQDAGKVNRGDQAGQPGSGRQNERTGQEIQSPPLHRSDSKDATMGKPGSAGAGPNRRDEGETQTQETEFMNESDGANIDEPRATGNRAGQGSTQAKGTEAQGREAQNRPGSTDQNRGGQAQSQNKTSGDKSNPARSS